MEYRFEDGELDDVTCPSCGGDVEVTEPMTNKDGDTIEMAFCPACSATEAEPRVMLPKSLMQPRA